MTAEQLSKISPEALAGISSSQLAVLPTGLISSISNEQLVALGSKQLVGLTTGA
jgi:hypothetical protein